MFIFEIFRLKKTILLNVKKKTMEIYIFTLNNSMIFLYPTNLSVVSCFCLISLLQWPPPPPTFLVTLFMCYTFFTFVGAWNIWYWTRFIKSFSFLLCDIKSSKAGRKRCIKYLVLSFSWLTSCLCQAKDRLRNSKKKF